MRRLVVICWAFFVAVCSVVAEDGDSLSHWGGSIGVSPGVVLNADQYQRKWQKGKNNLSVEASVQYSAIPEDSDAFAADYDYPTLSASMKMAFNHGVTMHRSPDPAWGLAEEVDYDSRMGNAVSFYGTFSRPLLRRSRWMLDYSFSMGVGYSHSKYDPKRAIDNELIGSRWLIYFGAGVHATYRVAPQWGIRGGVDYWHISNGALNRPNKGANFIGPSMAVVYYPYYPRVVSSPRHHFKPYPKRLYGNLSIGVGAKTLLEEWNATQFETPKGEPGYRTSHFTLFMAYSAQADVMWRYARRWASGAGIDLFYGSYASRVEQIDERRGVDVPHSPWSVGIAAKHQVFYHQLSLSMSIGYYLYREMGYHARIIEKPYYERIGIQYAFPKLGGIAVGASVKAHLTKADLTEFTVSFPVDIIK